jgi:regulator of protease activity HflC (stomatin/prohibitin superfamily)
MKYELTQAVVAGFAGLMTLPILFWIFRRMSVAIEDETTALITSFGKVEKILGTPGLHFLPTKLLPWVRIISVTRKLDFRQYDSIHVNDCRGTTVVIDLWVEVRICAPELALFNVESWERSLQSLLTSSATSILGTQEFNLILSNRGELGAAIREDLKDETSRWGIAVDQVFISKLSLIPEVAQHLFDTVAARLERAQADIEEAGRLKAAMLEADTSAQVAAFIAEAKGQYSLAVSRAYQQLATNPELFKAYRELYELSLIKPHRTVAFQGFGEADLAAAEAAMIVSDSNFLSSGATPGREHDRNLYREHDRDGATSRATPKNYGSRD